MSVEKKLEEAMRLLLEAERMDLVVSGEPVLSTAHSAHWASDRVAVAVLACSVPCRLRVASEGAAKILNRELRFKEGLKEEEYVLEKRPIVPLMIENWTGNRLLDLRGASPWVGFSCRPGGGIRDTLISGTFVHQMKRVASGSEGLWDEREF
ncbi:hypothetical protein NDU88_001273 [Pleurodeles waltl]|uniref:Uncharacterized protein n=1 Tax=Pleurodeles waltl TaxID=8319 RepID=A0AAV7WLN8_PLEWA|nr:hypothetical protein NDU88_001273 [Pleurodeles waltl]